MTPKEHKELRKQLENVSSRKFTAFEWFLLLVIVALMIGVPILAIVPQ